MKLNDILDNIDIKFAYIPDAIQDLTVKALCHNSKYATPNCAFFCRAGALTDGHLYAHNAYENGARLFIAEKQLDLPDDAAVIITSDSTDALNKTAVKFYNHPAKELKIIGITGTKGKTTVAISSYKIALASGIRAGYIGTNGIYYNGKQFETANTTPDVLELQKALREMRDDGVTTVFLEVSSQALWQKRTYGLEFDSCVFTNLYRDHIGGVEHPTFEHYANSKKSLFTDYSAKNIIINYDSPDSAFMIDGSTCKNIITTSASGNKICSLFASDIMMMKKGVIPGISFTIHSNCPDLLSKEQTSDIFIPMPGKYTVENSLLVIAVCLSLGIDFNLIANELAFLSIPGRFETVTVKSKPDSLFIIDYAHNGASLKAVIDSLRDYEPKRIICLFGSVGGRTFERRAELGRTSAENADVIIITSDNPNFESPASVIDDIRSSIGETDKPIYTFTDRADAIIKAYELAEEGDFVLFAGKGHESYQLISGKRVPFSERNILESIDLSMLLTR